MNREPLPKGYVVSMANNGEYVINQLIGEGGFSLIYSADTVGGTSPVVIKEFFPAEGAFRDSTGKVVSAIGNEDSFNRNLNRFELEGRIGGDICGRSFQTIPFLKISEGYAMLKRESEDMRSISSLVELWEESAPIPQTGNCADRDPVFPDMVRVRYSLKIIESVLAALTAVHEKGYLHLDISSSNVIWAGSEVETGENCEAFLADFGCSVELDSGEYHPEYQLSYSPGFAAPEVQKGHCNLTPATDLYSVGMLLFYLCVGKSALEITHNRKRQIQRELSYLAIPERFRKELQQILYTATDDIKIRYQTAISMLEAVRAFRNTLPARPLNPDNTKAFTLYSLKSMLEGSIETHYSWAHELCDRRGISVSFPDSVFEPVAIIPNKKYDSDLAFFTCIMPSAIRQLIKQKLDANKGFTLNNILSCNYPREWKHELCKRILAYGSSGFCDICASLMNDSAVFHRNRDILFEIIADNSVLQRFYNRCNFESKNHIGLAMIALYALLGDDYFKMLFGNDPSQCAIFFNC